MKACIITGAGSGIGRATAIALASGSQYRKFALMAIGMDDLKQTEDLMREAGHDDMEILLFDQDLTQHEEVEAVIDEIYACFGRVDALINIAGYSKKCSFFDTDLALLKRTFEINVFATTFLTQLVTRHMREEGKGGVVAFVASTSGSTPRPEWFAYGASKAAVISITRSLTEEFRNDGIKIFCISPGRCATPMRRSLLPDEDVSDMMKPEDVARILAFCAENPDNCLDGHDIIVRKLN